MTDADDTKRILQEWSAALLDELELTGAPVDIDAILRLAGVAAHSVIRPAAPVTTYIVGYAAGLAAANASVGLTPLPADYVAETAMTRAEGLAEKYGDSASR